MPLCLPERRTLSSSACALQRLFKDNSSFFRLTGAAFICLAMLLLSACGLSTHTPMVASKADAKTSLNTSFALPHPSLNLPPQILRYGSGVPASPKDFLEQAAKADYILIGEQHTAAQHHESQAALIALLAQNGYTPAIGLEMIPASLQARLDAFNARLVSVDDLSAHLDWENVWGFNFDGYKPVFTVAEYYNIPVYGLNVSQEVIKAIRKHGSPAGISPRQKTELPPVIQYPTTAQYNKLSRFFTQHASMLMGRPAKTSAPQTQTMVQGKTEANLSTKGQGIAGITRAKPQANHGSRALRRFITIQSLWDSAMAYNATQTGHQGPLVILAGGAHVEYGYGIAYRLAHFVPKAKSLTVMPLNHPHKIGTGEADFYYLTKGPQ